VLYGMMSYCAKLIGENLSRYIISTKRPSLYNRLRIGHTRLTHSCLIEHADPAKYIDYNHLLSVKHILTECRPTS